MFHSTTLWARHNMTPRTSTTPRSSSPAGQVTEVIQRLYISDLSAAEDATLLSSLGITHVLSAMRGHVLVPSSVEWKQIPLEDNPFAELAAHLPTTTAFLRDALGDSNSRVLVHCAQGVSRSSSVVAAFLIAQYGWTPAQAVQFVKDKRSTAEPNFGFMSQLQEYADAIRVAGR